MGHGIDDGLLPGKRRVVGDSVKNSVLTEAAVFPHVHADDFKGPFDQARQGPLYDLSLDDVQFLAHELSGSLEFQEIKAATGEIPLRLPGKEEYTAQSRDQPISSPQ